MTTSSRENVAAAPSGDHGSQNPGDSCASPGGLSGVRERSASPSLPGIPGETSGDRECLPPGLFAGAKVLRPADGDRWNEAGGGRERSGKINSSQKNIEFKCC